jgi:hypothetical protein
MLTEGAAGEHVLAGIHQVDVHIAAAAGVIAVGARETSAR